MRIGKTIVKQNPADPNEYTDRQIDWQIDRRKYRGTDRQTYGLDNPAIELSKEAKKLNTAVH